MGACCSDGSEREDFGTDKYVSDCNKLPFTEPLTQKERIGCATVCLVFAVVLCAIAGGLYLLIR